MDTPFAQRNEEDAAVPVAKVAQLALSLVFVKLNDALGSGPGAVAGRMATTVVTAVVKELLDNSLANTLATVGRAQLEAARDTLSEVPVEAAEHRRREKLNIAQGHLRAAYRLLDAEGDTRRRFRLGTRRPRIEAHRLAVESALFIATIDGELGSDPVNIEKWAARAIDHFERYAPLALASAGNGFMIAGAGTGVAAISGGALTLVGAGIGTPVLLGAALGAKRTWGHIRTPDRVEQERKLLLDLCFALGLDPV
jgi:hypothetical protein